MSFSSGHTVLALMKLACTVYEPESSYIHIRLVKINLSLNFSGDPVTQRPWQSYALVNQSMICDDAKRDLKRDEDSKNEREVP